jgi:hypothetical protein
VPATTSSSHDGGSRAHSPRRARPPRRANAPRRHGGAPARTSKPRAHRCRQRPVLARAREGGSACPAPGGIRGRVSRRFRTQPTPITEGDDAGPLSLRPFDQLEPATPRRRRSQRRR